MMNLHKENHLVAARFAVEHKQLLVFKRKNTCGELLGIPILSAHFVQDDFWKRDKYPISKAACKNAQILGIVHLLK